MNTFNTLDSFQEHYQEVKYYSFCLYLHTLLYILHVVKHTVGMYISS